MTIKEFSREQGVSVQAVYQKLKAAGVKISSIKKEKSQELTAEGLEVCRKLYLKQDESKTKEIAALNERLAALEAENKNLKADLEREKQKTEELKAERDRWAAAAEAAQVTAQQAQALQMASLKALPAPRRSLWARLTGKDKE